MLRYVIIFFVIALIAGIFGFSGIAAGAVEIARTLFIVFIALFILAAVLHVLKGKAPPV